ncbi:MAG TPA: SRPBCC domain-containing protein [Candidatus Dormibacteraeota bacterium]|nr:SRPBCC domain-containing protein [Candidatus Dormibacteraeota bacterium]
MEIKLAGDFTVERTPAEVYSFLVDPNRFCPLLPDLQSMEVMDAKNFLVKVKVGISHIRGTAAVKMTLVEEQPTKQAVYEGEGEIPGGSTTLRAHFQLVDVPGGHTKVIWSGQSSVRGRIISLSGGLLEPLGKKNVQKLIDGLQKALASNEQF